MQSNLSNVCSRLCKQFSSGYLFWHHNPPRNYSTGLLLSGTNFMLCGANPLNEVDNRWLTRNELTRNDFTVHREAQAQPFIIWSDNCIKHGRILPCDICSVLSIEAYNAWQLNPPPESPQPKYETPEIIGKLSPYPYKTLHGIKLFAIPENKNPGDYIYDSALSLLREKHKHLILGSTDDVWNRITADITMCKMLYTLGCKPYDEKHYDITLALLAKIKFDSAAERLKLLRCFTIADRCVETLLAQTYEEPSIPDELKSFISTVTWKKLQTLGTTEQINTLKHNAKLCAENRSPNLLTMCFIAIADNESLEFYAQKAENGHICGILKNGGLSLEAALPLKTLQNTFIPDLSFSPCSSSTLLA